MFTLSFYKFYKFSFVFSLYGANVIFRPRCTFKIELLAGDILTIH